MDIKLPKLGEGAESGTVASVLVKVGDTVTEGQTVIEVENEKAIAPIPAPASGKVAAIRVKLGDKISAGHLILTLDGPGPATIQAAPPATVQPKARPAEPGAEAEPAEPAGDRPAPETEMLEESGEPAPTAPGRLPPAAAPSLRRLAQDLGIDLALVRGSERGGRIVLADLRSYIQRLQKLAAQPKQAKATPPAPAPAPARPAERIDFSKWGAVTRKPLTPLRQTISRRMAENWNAIPHVTQFDEADITGVNALRKQYAPAYEKAGAKLTLTSFVLKAVVDTLKQHPVFNCSLDEAAQELVYKEYFHLGVAVDTDQGLIVPVIRDVDKKDLLQLSRELADLATKSRERKVALEELKGGTFTISNQGGIGGGPFTPIINRPEVAILGLGRGALKPLVRSGKIEPRWTMPVCLSYDHRVIDGANAARFIVDLVAAFETFPEAGVRL